MLLGQLVEKGRLDPNSWPPLNKGDALDVISDQELEEVVCQDCPFKAEDCDYQSVTGPVDAEPCGGYILLRLLKKEQYLTPAILKSW